MSAQEALRRGDLEAALQQLQQQVRQEPAVSRHRVFLFQLQVVLGQWQRAKTQLDVLRDLDAATLPMVNTYRPALRCELLRLAVFAGKRTPMLFGQPQQWAADMVHALQLSAEGRAGAAHDLRQRALEAAPAVAGRLGVARPGDGREQQQEQPFAWLADADSRLGPLLEMIVNGKYYWVPATAVRTLRIEAPADLRDFVWLPATVRWQNGGEAIALLPARYPGSEGAGDAALRLSRRTEWCDQGHDTFHGLGQRVLTTDTGEHGLLDVRQIAFEAA
jgi:type VI secretion system protein ImpE